ncbi:MAG: urease accessory protein UreF [Oleiphilaceae bacterium]|uniref:urease accessory protein UreF n=2 Tax=Oleiphilus sp. HI0125 TaxID=1822266 RepID=UPI0007C3CF49|nr:urease accessory UreF family protein [Oleiphilus sp. HI0125]KZZ58440.1 hypothetical protein A3762_07920 [Oleiphilus sp. HI0125]MCH2159557.1 urease accessory protein UreF [Oleiphilaceae bacterium]
MIGLLYLASPTLPIGSFAYSQGLEKVIETERVSDRESLRAWCFDYIRLGLCQLDIPLLSKLYHALENEDQSEFEDLNELVFASRETSELYSEELNLGQSLRRLIRTQDAITSLPIVMPSKPSFLAAYAYAAKGLGLSINELKVAFLWSWLENQAAVACKAIPLGQTDAQSILLESRELIERSISAGEGEVYGSLPGQVIFSALHETQYSRLFRS